MAISRAQLLKELVPGLNALFGLEYNRYPQEWSNVYDTESSERAFEEEQKLSGFGLARTKNEGSSVAFDNAQEVWTARYTHETVALGFSITEEAMEDNLYDSLSTRYTKALARSMSYTKDVKGAAILNNGFTTYNSGDGVPLFSTAHPTVNGTLNANAPAIPVDLNETAIEAMTIQIAAWTDERGLLIAAKPKKLIIPPNLMFVAERLMKSRYRVGTTDNDISAMMSMNVIPEGFTVNHFLTGNYSWYVKTDVPDGLKHFTRAPLKTSDEEDFVSTNYLYKARERYSFGVSDPLGIWGTNPIT
ncbi:hypothetical protein UFOVP28_35 [uncultured Caudovirales phage]|uniref:Bacteriophage Mu, GpT n=1 Tax=uncultured Caudovirales phage TaxID=2100421 RepID=A0A6J5KMY8_9CAUD|nr:hypothetical protein UFOVP28_35 [uncultured Caudovirales phage]